MKKGQIQIVVALVFFVMISISSYSSSAEVGVTETEIIIGTSMPLTGSMAWIGNQNTRGLTCMINEINEKGGIYGRKIKHIVMDDAYVSPQAVANARRMIEKDQVFCFIMNTGTHTIASIVPILNQYKVPLYGAGTNAKMFSNHPLIFLHPATYRHSCIQSIRYMMKEKGRKRIAMFYTDHQLGYEYLDAAKEYLKAIGKELVAEEKCKEADFDMSSQALKLKKSEADCVVVGATIGTSVKIIKAMHQIGYYPEIIGTMMLGNPGFIEVTGKDSEGVFMTLTSPALTSRALDPYRELGKKYFPDKPFDNFMSAGMAQAYVFAEGLRRAGKDLTREKFIKAIETINNKDFPIPFYEGANFYFAPKKHNGTSSVIIGQVIKGQIEQVTNWIDWKDMPVPEAAEN